MACLYRKVKFANDRSFDDDVYDWVRINPIAILSLVLISHHITLSLIPSLPFLPPTSKSLIHNPLSVPALMIHY